MKRRQKQSPQPKKKVKNDGKKGLKDSNLLTTRKQVRIFSKIYIIVANSKFLNLLYCQNIFLLEFCKCDANENSK